MALVDLNALREECELSVKFWEAFQLLTGSLGKRLRTLALLQPQIISEAVGETRVRKSESEPLGHQIPQWMPAESDSCGALPDEWFL